MVKSSSVNLTTSREEQMKKDLAYAKK